MDVFLDRFIVRVYIQLWHLTDASLRINLTSRYCYLLCHQLKRCFDFQVVSLKYLISRNFRRNPSKCFQITELWMNCPFDMFLVQLSSYRQSLFSSSTAFIFPLWYWGYCCKCSDFDLRQDHRGRGFRLCMPYQGKICTCAFFLVLV